MIEQLQNIILNEVDSLNRKWVPKEKFAERLAKKILAAQQSGQADVCPETGGQHRWEPDGSTPHECCSACGTRR